MKVLSAEDIRNWDQYTITNEPIAPIDLMERAATRCAEWIMAHYPDAESFAVFCGNGGDGLAIARMLLEHNYRVTIYILEFGHKGTADFQMNLARLHRFTAADIHFIQASPQFPSFTGKEIIIDALFGTGLNRALEGITAELVDHINLSGCEIVSIDIPSGLFTDRSSKNNKRINATHTIAFECYKPAFLVPENGEAIGELHLLHIGLHGDYYKSIDTRFRLITGETVSGLYKKRKSFFHKGKFGHSLLLAGSKGKIGAALLAAKACLRTGTGLLTCHIPSHANTIFQTAVPEAMISHDRDADLLTGIPGDLERYNAVGIGPGIGTNKQTLTLFTQLLEKYRRPAVIDADGLNLLAGLKELMNQLPAGTILTPHPKEFERLFGSSNDDFERIELAIEKAKELNVVIVLKGHNSFITASPAFMNEMKYQACEGFFNSTGNAGMAKGGSGDVLTGMITALLAQGYDPLRAAILGVYLHGLAGDLAASQKSEEAMIASDIVEAIGDAFKKVGRNNYTNRTIYDL